MWLTHEHEHEHRTKENAQGAQQILLVRYPWDNNRQCVQRQNCMAIVYV